MCASIRPSGAFRPQDRSGRTRRWVILALPLLILAWRAPAAASATPAGTLIIGVHVSLAPNWFDPAETLGIITPYMVLYALHDAMIKPMPAGNLTPGLAETWSVSADGRTFDFVLRKGTKFHNGEPVTAEDVKFSFDRYHGAGHTLMKERVASVDIPAPGTIRFHLTEPWPDFLTYYSNATGAGWIVPKRYVETVGEENFKKAPIGAGSYKFVSFTPGVELVVEAFDGFWRKQPAVKRIVFKVIPDEATRLVALKRGEIDIAYSIRGELANEVQNSPGLTLKPTVGSAPYWVYFPDQWDPKSPWHDKRVRLAVKYALDYDAINQALTLGFSHITGSVMPENFDFYKPVPKPVHDKQKARALLAEAGYPEGFDAGFYTCDAAYANLGEAVINSLGEVGIRAKLRPLERVAFFKGYSQKKYKDLIQGASGAFGNVATRMESFVVAGGTYAYGSHKEIDALFPLQAREMDIGKRTELLHRMQDILDREAMYVSVWQLAFISAVGPRVGESGIGLIKGFVYAAPYEDLTLKGG